MGDSRQTDADVPFRLEESWRNVLADALAAPSFSELTRFVRDAYAAGECCPPAPQVFRAFAATPFDRVRVVILGQDPYHRPGQANGLAFSVPCGVQPPPSLVNIFKELEAEGYGRAESMTPPKRAGDLSSWAAQGVLLLNATLTVAPGDSSAAGSHAGRGWEQFTDAAVRALAGRREGLVYMLWGASARKKGALVDRSRNLVLECAHPSPLSAHRGFFGCGHFRKCNDYLVAHGGEPVAW